MTISITKAVNRSPKCWSKTVAPLDVFPSANLITFSSVCTSLMLNNLGSHNVTIQLNGDSSAQFTLSSNTSHAFSNGDLDITSVDFQGYGTSGGTNTIVEVIAGLMV